MFTLNIFDSNFISLLKFGEVACGLIIQFHMIFIIVSVPILALLAFYLVIKHRYRQFSRQKIPFAQPKFPFGNAESSILRRRNVVYDVDDVYRYMTTYVVHNENNLKKKKILFQWIQRQSTVLRLFSDVYTLLAGNRPRSHQANVYQRFREVPQQRLYSEWK